MASGDVRHAFLIDPIPSVPRGAVSLKVSNIRPTPGPSEFGIWHYTADVQQVLIGEFAQKSVGVTIHQGSSCGPHRFDAKPQGTEEYSESFYVVGYPVKQTTLAEFELFPFEYRQREYRIAGEVDEQNRLHESNYRSSFDNLTEPFEFGPYIVGGLVLFALGLLWIRLRFVQRPNAKQLALPARPNVQKTAR